MNKYVQRIRYPPFEYSHMNANSVPLVEVVIESDKILENEFKIGQDDSWFVEWRKYNESDSNLSIIKCEVTTDPLPFLMRTRNGWYITPDPLHLVSRKIIGPTVMILIASILIHATEPGLLELGIISESFAGSYRLGPLDYPKLLLFSFPIFLLPLAFRMFANMRDIRKQNNYVNNPLKPPDIEIKKGINHIDMKIISTPKEMKIERARLQVGIAVPEREKILMALKKEEGQQPSPGMSTKPPEKRISTGDEMGTGVGEATPMAVSHSRVLILESLRVLESGEWSNISNKNKEIRLNGPTDKWPGSIYSALIAIHWELIIEATRDDGTKMKWVRPINMTSSNEKIEIGILPVRSGRIEMSDY